MSSEQLRRAPYLPFLDGPPDFAPNLKPIASSRWLVPDSEADVWLSQKHDLMRKQRDLVCSGDLDGAAAHELLDLVQADVSVPIENGWPSALEQAASIVSDDMCILAAKRTGDWRLQAGVLCAPTYWTLPERIGLDLGGLHGPVPGGDPDLAGRISRIFTGLQPGAVLERLNWTIQPSALRFTPERVPAAGKQIADLHLRVERQTIRKLPDSGAVVFTIRICVDPLMPILREGMIREAFEDAWLGAAARVRRYKAWDDLEGLVAEACRLSQASAV